MHACSLKDQLLVLKDFFFQMVYNGFNMSKCHAFIYLHRYDGMMYMDICTMLSFLMYCWYGHLPEWVL